MYIMNWKIVLKSVLKSLGVAIISTIIPLVFVGFYTNSVPFEGLDDCGYYMRQLSTTWSVLVFLTFFVSSLVIFGIGKNK